MRPGRGWVPCALGGALLMACAVRDEIYHPLASTDSVFGPGSDGGSGAGASSGAAGTGAARGTGGGGQGGVGGTKGSGGRVSAGGAGAGAGGVVGGSGGVPAPGTAACLADPRCVGGLLGAGGSGGQTGTGGAVADAAPDGRVRPASPSDAGPIAPWDGSIPACLLKTLELGTQALVATGPTPAFAGAYAAAVAPTVAGPFVLRLTAALSSFDDTARAGFVAAVGAAPVGGSLQLTGPLVEFPVARFPDGVVVMNPWFAAFTLALGGSTIQVAGIQVAGQQDSACTRLRAATVTLYVDQSQASVPFGGSTLGALLGSPNADVGTGTLNGWAIPLSGDTTQVTLP